MAKLTDYQKVKLSRGGCVTPFCRKSSRHDSNYCHTCIKRKYANKYPLKYCFQVLKNNAKRRCKEFSLTLDQFRGFVSDTDYLALRGRTSECLTIDRIDNDIGYHIENIRAISMSANASKNKFADVPF